nr:adenosylhomocysteinase [Parafrankia elaeagni]
MDGRLTLDRPTHATIVAEPSTKRRIEQYFLTINNSFPSTREVATIVVTHMLPDRPFFLDAVAHGNDLISILPKPKSCDPGTRAAVSSRYHCDDLERDRFVHPAKVLAYIEERAAGRDLALLDIGGYFAPALTSLCRQFSGRIVGVVEDTENGYRKYLSCGKLPCPVFSVARSPLKQPEDYLVGQSIVFSTESLLREHGDILHGRETCVIGYGKIGRSVANTLRAKSVRTTVYETDPVRAVEAMSHGFAVKWSKAEALGRADVVVCATGNRALEGEDFTYLRPGSYVASVTSSDDELNLASLRGTYRIERLGPHLSRMTSWNHHFYLLNDGNAVNFVHGAAVGPFIFLVQGEILAALALLSSGQVMEPGLHEVGNREREIIARSWLRCFNEE